MILGPSSFISTLDELKQFLKFNPLFNDLTNKHDIILFHKDILKDKDQKLFIDNSNAIKICASKKKDYLLNKNEKKLSKFNNFVILTEKEIQLLELFLSKKKPISKDNILSIVWNYSSDADTHTVETHIYRLRKKINDKFMDEKFIFNNKKGYYLWKKEIK